MENVFTDAKYAKSYMPFFSGILRVDPFSLPSFSPFISTTTKTYRDVVLPSTIRKSLNNSWNQNQSDRKDDKLDFLNQVCGPSSCVSKLDFLIQVCGSFPCVSIVEIEIYSNGQDTENRRPLDLSPLLGKSVRRVILMNCPVLPRTDHDRYARTNILFSGDHPYLQSIHFMRAQTVTPRYREAIQQPHFIQPTLSDGTSRRPLSVSSSILSCAKELKGFCDMVKRLKKSGVRLKKLFIALNIDALDRDKKFAHVSLCLPKLIHIKGLHFIFWRNYHRKQPTSHPIVQNLIARNPNVPLTTVCRT
jgi:hypothetical protein